MKRLLIICCLAIFLAGCSKTETPKNTGAGKAVPPKPVATAKPTPPVSPRPPMPPPKGSLDINIYTGVPDHTNSFRWAEIYLDGAFISRTYQIRLNLDPGTHTIAIKAQGYKTYERNIMILPSTPIQVLDVLLEPE